MNFSKHSLDHNPSPVDGYDNEKGRHEAGKESASETDPLHNGSQDIKEQLSPSRAYYQLWTYASPIDWVLRIIAALAAMGGGSAYPLMTLIFGDLVNDFNAAALGISSPSEFRASVSHNALWFVYLFIGKFGLLYIADFLLCFTAAKMARRVRLAYLKKVLHQPISYFDHNAPGSVAASLSTDTNNIEVGLADKVASVCQALGMIIGALAVSFSKAWKMTLVVGTTIPYILITTGIIGTVNSHYETLQRRDNDEAAKIAEEALSSVSNIKALGADEKIVKNFEVPVSDVSRRGLRIGPIQATLYGNMFFSIQSTYALALFYGVKLVSRGEIRDGGTVMIVLFCMMLGSSAMGIASPTIPNFLQAAASAQKVLKVLSTTSHHEKSENGSSEVDVQDIEGHLSVKGVTFCYPSRPTVTVLDHLTLDIPANKTTAIVGHSGSGKSTIVGLLERWYEPAEGTITLDGVDIQQIKVSSLRSQIAFVQQDPTLFNDTIFQNILNGYHGGRTNHLPEQEKNNLVTKAAIQASIHDFIMELPNGYNTMVGERATLLSGGQKQRIAIARSIISNPKILLLDEATSALDQESENAVQSALEKASAGRTTLIIAHKLSTIENADNIVVMDKGHIVEQGTHKSLLALDGVYCRLLRAQSVTTPEEEERQKETEEPVLGLTKTASEIKPLGPASDQPLPLDSTSISRRLGIFRCCYIILRDTKRILPAFFGGVIGACVAGAAMPMQAFLFSKLVTVFQLTGQHRTDRANFWALMFFVLALTNLLSYAILWFLFSIAGSAISKKYRTGYLRDLLAQEIKFFEVEGNSSGALTALMSTDGDDLSLFFSMSLALMVVFAIDIAACGIMAIAVGWRLGLVGVFGCFPVLFLAGYCRLRMDAGAQDRCAASFLESTRYGSEAVEAIKTVSSLSLEDKVIERYNEKLKNAVLTSTKKTFVSMIFFALSDCMDFLALALVFWYGGQLVSRDQLSVQNFFLLEMAIIFGGQGAGFIFGYSSSITKAHAAMNRILYMRSKNSLTKSDSSTSKQLPSSPSAPAIVFHNVYFHYPTRPNIPILKSLSFNIPHGKNICIVGPSGSGKSTIISLLERFYNPTAGQILVNGTDISTLDASAYRSSLALVSQETCLYQGSIKENLLLGVQREVTDEELQEVCSQANIHTFISSLPSSYSTNLGPRGLSLSGGQRQRLAIARALLRNPDILLLDEATSALDPESQALVLEALERAGKGRTTVSVSHHADVVRRADWILVVEQGRVVEEGGWEELVRRRGRLWEMWGVLMGEG